jgi:hypothetical protein
MNTGWKLFKLLLLLLKGTYIIGSHDLHYNDGQEIRISCVDSGRLYTISGDFSKKSVKLICNGTEISVTRALRLRFIMGPIIHDKNAFKLIGSPLYIGCKITLQDCHYYFRRSDRVYMLTLGISTRVLSLTEAPSTRKRVGLSIEDTDNVFDKFDSSEAMEHDYDELIRLTRGVNTKSARFF